MTGFAFVVAPHPALALPGAIATEVTQSNGQELVLSAPDVDRYQKIFKAQERGEWRTADKLIKELENDVLMGHVLYQRYMHPTAYRSKYSELKAWMAKYADHPDASKIYALAMKRRPASEGRPERAEKRYWRTSLENPGLKSLPPRRHNSADRRRVSQIQTYVRDLLRRERPTQALNYLNENRTRKDLTSHEFDQLRQWIANSYYLENVDAKALRVSKDVIASNGEKVPLAYWTAGLVAWRTGDKPAAANYFEHVAGSGRVAHSDKAAGAYWSARSYLVTRSPEKVTPLLEVAASSDQHFYGILAKRQLGRELISLDDIPDVSASSVEEALKLKGVARAVALAQVGQLPLAQEEMRRAHGKADASYDPALMHLAMVWDMPYAQIDIANYSVEPSLSIGRYPVPNFEPKGGFTLDRALVYAFIRQESKFNTEATSRVGARGLMQLMPNTAVHVAKDRSLKRQNKDRLYDPSFNMMLGQKYIQELMTSYDLDSNLFGLLVAYNGGPGNLKKWSRETNYKEDPLLFIESIPSRETRGFIEAVLGNYWMYQARLGEASPSLDHVVSGTWPSYVPLTAE
ncbi:MAG: lytic transglycosylase domain-containing protein [Alphaproteobacteria bacterium]|nr:MAG: lytic transglycosylase domain-containing protein [Alphaproteobacteria bacterium]